MRYKKIVLLSIFLVALFAVGTVCAAENATEDVVGSDDNVIDDIVSLEKDDQIIAEEPDTGTFDELSGEINATEEGGVINLTKNYKFNGSSKDGIVINKSITINGNNYKLDGCNQARIFTVFDGNVTLNNLILVNGFAENGGALFVNKTVTCNNVVFENNHATKKGGAIYTNSNLTLDHCTFNGGYAERGAAIYANIVPRESYPIVGPGDDTDYGNDTNGTYDGNETYDGNDTDEESGNESGVKPAEDLFPDLPEREFTCKITNSVFKNFNDICIAMIYLSSDQMFLVANSTFANSTSQYATALYSDGGNQIHINNTFVNLHASKSAGAFFVGEVSMAVVDNCIFDNVTSYYDGGAFVVDGQGWRTGGAAELVVNNTIIKNSKSKYGSAITFCGGSLFIINSTLSDNYAQSNALIYLADANAKISNSTFKNNKINLTDNSSVDSAIIVAFKVRELMIIDNVYFTNNSNVLFACDLRYKVFNTTFENNGRAIYCVLPQSTELRNATFNNDTVDLNASIDTYYKIIVNSIGAALNLTRNEFNISALPFRYDSREWGWVTPVRDQWFSGGCWVFSTCAALEVALLKSTGIEYNLSVQNIQKNLLLYARYGEKDFSEAGLTHVAAEFILSWYGPLPVEYDQFDIIGKITEPYITEDAVHIQDVVWVSPHKSITDIDGIKWAIIKYGAITGDMVADYDSIYFNRNTSAAYYNETGEEAAHCNHAVCIVGWDDSYPASKFNIIPPGNGAWIVKNSYGNQSFDNGYIYISYYDTKFLTESPGMAFVIENTENYNKNYQTDISGDMTVLNKSENYSFKNSYVAIDDDFISAVGTYFNYLGEDYVVEIYVNDELRYTQNGTAPFRGFHTIKLANYIPVRKGDKFTVVMKTHSVFLLNNTLVPLIRGVSWLDNGTGWTDVTLRNYSLSLKVYTKPLVNLSTTIEAANVTTVYNGGKYLIVDVKDVFGDPISGVNVTIKLSNGHTKTLTTNSKGRVKLSTDKLDPNTYTATITTWAFGNYINTTSTAKIVVKKATPKLTAKNKAFKSKTKIKKYAVILKSGKNPVKKVKVTLKINGKTYKAKTTKKGKAIFKIKKLTKKGNFKAVVSFKGNDYYNKVNKKVKITIK